MEGEAAAALRHRPQIDGVAAHLSHGHLRRDHLVAVAGGIHAHDAAPALVQIADDVAHVAVGHSDLQLAHRLQQDRVGLRQGGLVGQLRRGLKGDFGGVHRMVGAVVQHGLQVHHGIARQGTVGAGLPQALLHRREEVLGHAAAEDLLGEDHVVLLRLGFKPDPHVAELAAAAGLLLVAALLLDSLADLLPIGHPHGLQIRLHIEAALQLADQHIHLHVAGAVEHHLVGLGVVGDGEGGILLVHTGQALGDLVLLAPGLGHDGHGIAGLCEGQFLQGDDLPGVAQGIAGLDLLHLADGADVAAAQLLHLGGLLAPHRVQAAQFFRDAGAGVDHGQIRRQGAGEHLDEAVLAVLVRDGLEHEGRRHAAGGDHKGLRLAVLAGGLVIVALHGVGQQVHDVVQQHQAAHAVDSGAAQHGEQAQLPHALAQALNHLGVGEVLAAEELVHELLAGFGHGLLQGVVELLDDGVLALGDLDLHPLLVLHLIGALVQHVDDAGDLLALVPDGHHQRRDLVAEPGPQSLEGGVVVAVVLVGLGDIDKAGHIPLLAVFPRLLQAHGHAVLGGADDDGGVGGPQSLDHLAGEVERARRVQHVDPAPLVLQRRHSGGDGDLPLGLLRIIVADRIPVRAPAHPVDGPGHIQQALCQGGLAVSAVAQQTDVADVLYRIAHVCSTPYVVLLPRPVPPAAGDA